MSKTDLYPRIKSRGAVFLDRDGTIIREVNYLSRLADIELLPRAAAAIAELNRLQVPVILVSNQSGIARGKFNLDFVDAAHRLLQEMLTRDGAHLDDFFFCPHHPTAGQAPFKKVCDCRKPEPGLLYAAAARHQLELTQSYVVGDKLLDIELARRVGGKGLLVETGHGLREKEKISAGEIEPDFIAADLYDAVNWILTDLEKGK
ncbi:MAG: HAD family hydrolase [Deltaproteobacteria bacterium]|nr:HAD family hydrolase [Deltaproteobacteria bacterium]